jgi:hypothetical protein
MKRDGGISSPITKTLGSWDLEITGLPTPNLCRLPLRSLAATMASKVVAKAAGGVMSISKVRYTAAAPLN